MTQQKEPDKAETTYRSLHLSAEELAQLSPDELLQACLEVHRLLAIIMGVLYTPDSTLMLRAVESISLPGSSQVDAGKRYCRSALAEQRGPVQCAPHDQIGIRCVAWNKRSATRGTANDGLVHLTRLMPGTHGAEMCYAVQGW